MNRSVAILVIHGIGEQDPFETLDAFVKPFVNLYSKFVKESHPKASIRRKHTLAQFTDWIESYISLISDVPDKPVIDIYEYYWAYMTQREITPAEVVEWVFDVAKGAKKFYKREKSMKNREKNDILFTRDGEFRYVKYLVNMLSFASWLRLIGLVVAQKFSFISPIKNFFSYISKGPLVDSLGDVALYTTTDKKSKYFDVRKRILNGAVEKAKFLIENEKYEEVILVGHSLGSVIAYDMLDRLNKEMNVDESLRGFAHKVKGFVTFGSPLDKIAFFFDEQINKKKQNIRYAIVSQLHGFKRVNVDTTSLENGVSHYFEHVKWLNFWTKPDPVSGHLDVYRDVENVKMDFSAKIKNPKWLKSKISIQSHSLYWQSDEMYQRIMEEFGLI